MSGSIRRRRRGSWEVSINLGRDPVSGKRQRRYVNVEGNRKAAFSILPPIPPGEPSD